MKKKFFVALGAGLVAFTPFTASDASTARDNEKIYQVALLQSLIMGY